MSFQPEHEIHRRRFSRNLGVGLVLMAFIALVFALTVVKVKRGLPIKGYNYEVQPELAPVEATQ